MATDITTFPTLDSMLSSITECFAEKTALQQYDGSRWRRMSYSEMIQVSKAHARILQLSGVRPGDRIILIEENSIEWVIAFLAILFSKATAVLIDPRLETGDFAQLIKKSSPQAILTSTKIFNKIPPGFPQEFPVFEIHRQYKSFEGTPARIDPCQYNPDGDPAIAVMMFTSGTTGDFKAVMLEHQAVLYAIKTGYYISQITADDRVLCILPLTHIFGLVASLLTPLSVGCTLTFVERLQGDAILKNMRETQTTILPAVPRVIELFHSKIKQGLETKHPFIRNLLKTLATSCDRIGWQCSKTLYAKVHEAFGGQLKLIISGGASLDHKLHEEMSHLGFVIVQGYGLTETAGPVIGNTPTAWRIGSAGTSPEWTQMHVSSFEGTTHGEVKLKTPSAMRGYFRDPKATASMIQDGWLHTGDLGSIDENGYLEISGRIKEIIVTSNGQKAMPADVERRYQSIPSIQEIVVVGMPAGHQEEIHAAVVASELLLSQKLPLEALQQKIEEDIVKCSAAVPAHLRIQKVHLFDAIPKTLTLKVKREDLRRRIMEKSGFSNISETNGENPQVTIDLSVSYDDLARRTLDIICSIAKHSPIKKSVCLNPKTSFQIDLGFDSLAMLELAFALEKQFQIRMTEDSIEKIQTIQDLIGLIQEKKNV